MALGRGSRLKCCSTPRLDKSHLKENLVASLSTGRYCADRKSASWEKIPSGWWWMSTSQRPPFRSTFRHYIWEEQVSISSRRVRHPTFFRLPFGTWRSCLHVIAVFFIFYSGAQRWASTSSPYWTTVLMFLRSRWVRYCGSVRLTHAWTYPARCSPGTC